MLLWLTLGCAPHTPLVAAPWVAEARLAGDEIAVLPLISLATRPEADYREGLGSLNVPLLRETGRNARTEQLFHIPEAIAVALPGEVGAVLGDRWDGHFVTTKWPVGTRDSLISALDGRADLDQALARLANGHQFLLVTWVNTLSGTPISAEGLPGEVVYTESGPVIVDLVEEPYRVRATVGVALIAPDGELLVRYADTFETVLNDRSGPARVGRTVARGLADEVGAFWPTDPAFADGWVSLSP